MLIFGVGEYAAVANYYLHGHGIHANGFTIDGARPTQLFHGKPVVEWLDAKPEPDPDIFIAVGYTKLNMNRAIILAAARERGFKPVSFISGGAHVFSLDIGEHCFILEANVIQPFVTIGDNCVIWSANHIGHHTRIGKNVWITSGCVISGGCEIGDNAFIGVGSCLADHVKVGRYAIVTMGSRVTKDVPDYGVWDGNGLRKVTSDRLKL